MKKFLSPFLFLIPVVVCSQGLTELPTDNEGRIQYEEKVRVDTISKYQLYVNSKIVFTNTYKPSNYIIQIDNQKAGSIVGTGYNDIYFNYRGVDTKQQMWFTIKIQYRDGSYEYTIYDIHCKSYPTSDGKSEPSYEKYSPYSNALKNNIQDIIRVIKTTMSKGILRQDNPLEFKFI